MGTEEPVVRPPYRKPAAGPLRVMSVRRNLPEESLGSTSTTLAWPACSTSNRVARWATSPAATRSSTARPGSATPGCFALPTVPRCTNATSRHWNSSRTRRHCGKASPACPGHACAARAPAGRRLRPPALRATTCPTVARQPTEPGPSARAHRPAVRQRGFQSTYCIALMP